MIRTGDASESSSIKAELATVALAGCAEAETFLPDGLAIVVVNVAGFIEMTFRPRAAPSDAPIEKTAVLPPFHGGFSKFS